MLQAADDLRQAVTWLAALDNCSGVGAGQAMRLLGTAYRLLGQAHMAEAEHSVRNPAAAVEVRFRLLQSAGGCSGYHAGLGIVSSLP